MDYGFAINTFIFLGILLGFLVAIVGIVFFARLLVELVGDFLFEVTEKQENYRLLQSYKFHREVFERYLKQYNERYSYDDESI